LIPIEKNNVFPLLNANQKNLYKNPPPFPFVIDSVILIEREFVLSDKNANIMMRDYKPIYKSIDEFR